MAKLFNKTRTSAPRVSGGHSKIDQFFEITIKIGSVVSQYPTNAFEVA
jgi:hypothetical protein